MPHRTYLLLSLIASANALTDNFVDGQCATNDGEDHFPHKSEAGDQFTDVISADYSLLWEVQYENDYKIVKNTKTGTVHVLHQCGLNPPSNEELPAYAKDGTMVEVPLTKIATTSTTYLAFLEMLGERKALKSYQSSFQYVSSPCLRKMHRDGLIEEKDAFADPPKIPDLEALGVQATFASSFGARPASEMAPSNDESRRWRMSCTRHRRAGTPSPRPDVGRDFTRG